MSYPRQQSVSKRLHRETLQALDAEAERRSLRLHRCWLQARRELRSAVHEAYRAAAPSGRWDLTALRMSGAEGRLRAEAHGILERFRAVAAVEMRDGLRAIRRMSALRHAWLLDQLTPECSRVAVPRVGHAQEASRQPVLTPESAKQFDERWALWVDSYKAALMSNLQHGAINGSTLEDAVGEVDATRVNTPSAALPSAMQRLFEFASVSAMAKGEDDATSLNGDLVEEEVWRTRGDDRVCDDCGANEGLPVEETDGDIPYHPNCHCFWEVVPRSFAKLLRSGSEQDAALADYMQARGLAPETLLIRNDAGEVAGKAVVTFERWVAGQERVLGGPL